MTGLVYLNGFIYSVSRDYSLIKWNVDGSKVKQVNNIHTDWIINIEVMRTKNLIITNSRDGSVKVSGFTKAISVYLKKLKKMTKNSIVYPTLKTNIFKNYFSRSTISTTSLSSYYTSCSSYSLWISNDGRTNERSKTSQDSSRVESGKTAI